MNTPCYTIHLDIFEKNCREVMDAFEEAWGGRVEYGYSVKTNHDAGLMKYAHAKLGWFIETVSPDELELAFNLGFDAENIIFNGPCKCSRQDALINAIRGWAYVNLDNLDAVASVVIGGTIVTGGFGYVLGSVIGALVRSTIDPLTSDFGVPAEWTTIVVGLMILIFVVLQRAVTAFNKKE